MKLWMQLPTNIPQDFFFREIPNFVIFKADFLSFWIFMDLAVFRHNYRLCIPGYTDHLNTL